MKNYANHLSYTFENKKIAFLWQLLQLRKYTANPLPSNYCKYLQCRKKQTQA